MILQVGLYVSMGEIKLMCTCPRSHQAIGRGYASEPYVLHSLVRTFSLESVTNHNLGKERVPETHVTSFSYHY